MKKYTLLICLLLIGFFSKAQTADTLNQAAEPIGGINVLALEYYLLELTKEQRKLLKNIRLEMIFLVSPEGKATLEEVNGIDNPVIIDSLMSRTPLLPPFHPMIENGVPTESLYFIQLSFPNYHIQSNNYYSDRPNYYKIATKDDFEYINRTGKGFKILLGLNMNNIFGSPSNYLKPGGGINMAFTLTPKKQIYYGINTAVTFNKVKKQYPYEIGQREYLKSLPMVFLGGIIGKKYKKFSVQFELSYVQQNLAIKDGADDKDWPRLEGWSPSVVINYPIKIGKEKINYLYNSWSYNTPSISGKALNLHLAVRPVLLPLPEATGVMVEFGVSYLMYSELIQDFKLKDSFLE